ncbi:LIM-domain binding protein-domain-containing protein [Pisolithus orientalis]|uniref:LIM-domain binding protein-domain-containing protein n=1 Tax=Pisolithus orientalis TaxID=936130 RepID=UPI002224B423|nr:LIM-domain binding protein-domain-containing protein [Pisolithus orientalis]KAI6035644.1 LIM-domain binding protein-domain-containing protein [Pisolithus orientalis]
MNVNVRQSEMLRQQNMPPIPPVANSHFLPQQQQPRQQQQPPNHMNLMANANNPQMSLLGGGAQANPNSLPMSTQRYQMPQQNTLQHGQNPQINPSAAAPGPTHMSALGALPGMPIQPHHPANGIQVRRTQSHPQGLNGHVPSMIPSQQAVNSMNMAMNPQGSLPNQLRQPGQPTMMPRLPGHMPGSMSPDILGRQSNPPGVPQGSLRQGSQTQLMNSLAQPSLQQSMAQNAFQQSVPHPHHSSSLTSSPRPGGHPQQHQSANMMMSAPGPSQASGPRPMGHGENTFVGISNPQFPANMVHGSARIPNNGSTFPFGPPVSQNDPMEMSQSLADGLANAANPPQLRPGFQPPSTQQFEQLQQTDNFGSHFNLQSQGNAPPTRPPSHPSSVHGNSIPPRSMQPPSQHSPRQSDPMTGHIQQQPQRPQSQPQGPPGRPPSSQTGPSHTPRSSQSQLPQSALVPPTRMPPQTQPQASPHQQRQSPSVQPPIAPRPPQGQSANAVPMHPAAASDPGASQPQPTMISRPQVSIAPPLGFGQGCIRLLQFSGQLSSEGNEGQKLRLSFWNNLVQDYFTPKAVMKITLWKDNKKVEAKPLEIGYSILPRFFLVTTQSGVKSMSLSLDGARERLVTQTHGVVECVSAIWTYKYDNGYTVTLRGPLTVHILLLPVPGSATQSFQCSLKIEHFQFDANLHEKFISLDAITGTRAIESPKTPRVRNNPTPGPNGAPLPGSHRTEEDRQWEEPRVLIRDASLPGEPVNAFGIPQVTMRCLEVSHQHASNDSIFRDCDALQLAEGVSQMTELIAFARETDQGPRGSYGFWSQRSSFLT